MGDMHEFMVSMDLRCELSDDEVAEVRWHLGLGPQPERLTIITEFPSIVIGDDGRAVEDEHGQWVFEDDPRPVWELVEPGIDKIGGAAVSALHRQDDRSGGRWALTCRWAVHPEDRGDVATLFDWLIAKRAGDERFFGYLRWYEDDWPDERLGVADGVLTVYAEGREPQPFRQG
ncbi:hypothetical protein [Plantactinospora sonchi]|uniref:DUF4265 domain-containing protein n=1 Tax=Plantactinospora sonchi TaxID=1544735 RepID=A0ABU7RVE0_9ACTN